MQDLKAKAIKALVWSFTERVGFQLVQFTIGIILARLLLPEDFGVVAILAVFIAILRVVVDCGLGAALIQRDDADYTDECTVFWFNCIASIFFSGALFLSAPLIAEFFDQPLYTEMVPVVSLILIFGAVGNIQVNVLTRRIDFKRQAIINVCAILVSGTTGVWMALNNFGAWSLVGQSTLHAAFSALLLWLLVDWRPKLIFSYDSFRKMFPYGLNLFVSSLIDTFFNNLYVLLIGKIYSPAQLGYFSKAKNLQEIPVENLYGILGRVAFPVFSRMQNDLEKFRQALKKSTQVLAFFSFPVMFGLTVVAEPFIELLLTDKWLPAVPFLQLLCLGAILRPISALNLSVLKALGRSDLYLKIEIVKKVLLVINILLTYKYGIEVMLMGAILVSITGFCVNAYCTGKLVKFGLVEQFLTMVPAIVIAMVMSLVVVYIELEFISGLFYIFLFKVVLGGATYFALSWIFNREPIDSFISLVGKKDNIQQTTNG